jgi:hypothetical protein
MKGPRREIDERGLRFMEEAAPTYPPNADSSARHLECTEFPDSGPL